MSKELANCCGTTCDKSAIVDELEMHKANTARLAVLNDYCQQNNIGQWGDSVVDSVIAKLAEMSKQQKIDRANALHTVNQLAKMSAERDALAAKCHAVVGVLLQVRDRWWPFVHGAVGASEAARGLLKKSADVLEMPPAQHLRDIQAEAVQNAIKSCVVVKCVGTKCISVRGLMQHVERVKAGE